MLLIQLFKTNYIKIYSVFVNLSFTLVYICLHNFAGVPPPPPPPPSSSSSPSPTTDPSNIKDGRHKRMFAENVICNLHSLLSAYIVLTISVVSVLVFAFILLAGIIGALFALASRRRRREVAL